MTPATLQLQGLAWLSLSTARRDLGDFKGSLEAASNAEKNMRKIIGSGTLVEEASIGLSTALGYQGTILGQGGAYDRAIAKLTEAATLLEPRASTKTPMLLQRLGQVDNSWANCLRFGGGGTPAALGAAGRRYRQSIDAYGRVVETLKPDDPARTVCRDWQARILSNLALFVAVDLKDINQGVVLAEQAAELARGLVRDFPSEIDGLDCLASCVTNVGEIRMELKNLEAARSLHAEALGLYERLASRVPENLDFRWGVAMAASSLGQSFMDGPGEDLPRAKSLLQRAANLFDKLSAESSGNAGLAENAALNRQRLAELEKRLHPAP